MLMFIWMCVMTSVFVPGGQSFASHHIESYEAQMRADLETAALAAPSAVVGAAQHVVRYGTPSLSRLAPRENSASVLQGGRRPNPEL